MEQALKNIADSASLETVLSVGGRSTHLLHHIHEAEVGGVLQHQSADESSAVGGVLCCKNAARQNAVHNKGFHCPGVVAVCQQMVLPIPTHPDTALSTLLHLGLLLFQEPDLILYVAKGQCDAHMPRYAQEDHLTLKFWTLRLFIPLYWCQLVITLMSD